MTDPNLPIGATNTGTNDWSDVHGEDQAIVDAYLTDHTAGGHTGSWLTDGTVTDAKLASPNNSTYKTLLTAGVLTRADMASGTYLMVPMLSYTSGVVGGRSLIASGQTFGDTAGGDTGGFTSQIPFIYFDNADVTVAGLTEKLRLRAQVSTNATAWSSVTATFGLYPVTFAGSADDVVPTLGTVVSGSTVAHADPGASGTVTGTSGDFTVPSDGMYTIGVVTSAQLTNNAAALLTAQLQTRNV